MPDITFKTKDEVPAELREHAKEANGVWSVNVVANDIHKGFRDNNVDLLKERDGLKTKLGGFASVLGYDDPEKAKTELTDLRSIAQKVKDGSLKTNEAIELEVVKRVKTQVGEAEGLVTQLKDQVSQAKATGSDWEIKYKGLSLDQGVTTAVMAADSGFNPSALPDIQSRARGVWRVAEDGGLVPYAADKVLYSKKEAGVPMSMKEWLAGLLAEAPHFGKSSSGGGAGGGTGEAGEMTAGMPTAEFQKLPPQERIRRHRAAARK